MGYLGLVVWQPEKFAEARLFIHFA